MTDSDLAHTFDKLQARLDPMLRQFGFRKHGRTYNRPTPEDLTQVIGFQMGRFDPPGTMHIPGLRENLYGKFTVNLGIYVPEVARNHGGGEAKSVVQDSNCCIRTRLGRKADKELWWKISDSEGLVAEISERLQNEAFPLFRRFETRNQILDEFRTSERTELMAVPRIVCAILLVHRGEREEARRLLQARDHTGNPRHPAYVIDLAQRLGIEIEP
jgi:uncharacterized protein DUF4304